MEIIHHASHSLDPRLTRIVLLVERATLAKRRWRGVAEDGKEFGFDLEHALHNAEVFHQTDVAAYLIEQKPEPVLEIALSDMDDAGAAKLGWMIGNLHFPLAIADGVVRAIDDPAVRQLLEREHIAFTSCERVFHALGGGHSHEH